MKENKKMTAAEERFNKNLEKLAKMKNISKKDALRLALKNFARGCV